MGWIDAAITKGLLQAEEKRKNGDKNVAQALVEGGVEFGADRTADFATFGASIFIRPFFAPILRYLFGPGVSAAAVDLTLVMMFWGAIVFVCFYSSIMLPSMLVNAGVSTWNGLQDAGIVNSRIVPCTQAAARLGSDATGCPQVP